MPKNAIKREGRVNFWKNIDYKKPETRPEPVMSNPNPTRTRRNISKPDPTRTRKKFQNPNPTRTRHLATRPITRSIFWWIYKRISIIVVIFQYWCLSLVLIPSLNGTFRWRKCDGNTVRIYKTLMEHFIEGILKLRHWYIIKTQMREKILYKSFLFI